MVHSMVQTDQSVQNTGCDINAHIGLNVCYDIGMSETQNTNNENNISDIDNCQHESIFIHMSEWDTVKYGPLKGTKYRVIWCHRCGEEIEIEHWNANIKE